VDRAWGDSTTGKSGKRTREEEWVESPGYQADTGTTHMNLPLKRCLLPQLTSGTG
jgi:hypothetical protein